MQGVEPKVSNADIDTLLLDFMRVLIAQHRLFYGGAITGYTSSVRLDLRHTANLFDSLGIRRQSAGTQWMLIIKLYRLQCLKEINFHYNGGGEWDAVGFFNYQFDYELMDNEVELVLIGQSFTVTLKALEQSLADTVRDTPVTYTCKLFTRDNRVYLAINERSFQVAKPSMDSTIDRLLRSLERRPSMATLTAIDFQPADNEFNFIRTLDKYKYRWLKPMLPVCEAKVISMQNPAELDMSQLLSMLPEIAGNYRQPIAQYLGVEQSIAE